MQNSRIVKYSSSYQAKFLRFMNGITRFREVKWPAYYQGDRTYTTKTYTISISFPLLSIF